MIAYFSGTGNSRHVASLLHRILGDEMRDIAEMRHADTLHCPDDRLIWVFPTYSWGVPPVVAKFIRQIGLVGRPCHYMVTTCGDDTGLTNDMWRKMIEAKGWEARDAYSVRMPNTYVFMAGFDVDPAETEALKIEGARDSVARIAGCISAREPGDHIVKGSMPWLKTRVVYPFFVRYLMSPRGFNVSDDCISCGLCARECPLDNITMRHGRPEWDNDCAFCTRCYHVCPRHAINYKHTARHKGQYRHFLDKKT